MKLVSKLGLALVLCAAPVLAHAGWKAVPGSQNVVITSTSASGTVGGARSSADSNQQIGCTYSNTNGVCFARSAANVFVPCSTTNANLLNVIRAVGPNSSLYFEFSGTTCTLIRVNNSSFEIIKTN